jgi:hypothetical protein
MTDSELEILDKLLIKLGYDITDWGIDRKLFTIWITTGIIGSSGDIYTFGIK